ncbi:hypothetical protein [Paraliobacillus sp. JSM ZJ581]|uniref:hypothetical protein n=1 Tax=Paraliobacillus sp. JSM ZJ581 TaxID=3342118 RepID=UPI0035A824FA
MNSFVNKNNSNGILNIIDPNQNQSDAISTFAFKVGKTAVNTYWWVLEYILVSTH